MVVLCLSCKREGPIPEVKPLLKTNEVNLNTGSDGGITVTGEFILSGSYRSIEYGFYFDKDASFKNPIIITSGNEAEPGKFELTAQIALKPDVKYYVRTWAKTTNYQVFGNTIVFQSNGLSVPVIERILPEIALWGDTIMIIGKNFDYFGKENKVRFNNVLSIKTWEKQDTIWAILPFVPDVQINKVTINVEVYNNSTQKGSQLMIAEPVILGISATQGQYPDTVTVTGNNFSSFDTQLLINGLKDSIIELNRKSLSFVVPYLKEEQMLRAELVNLDKNYLIIDKFAYHAQNIQYVSPNMAWIGDTILLYAKNIDFRRILLNIINPDPKLLSDGGQSLIITRKWKDSIAFVLNGSSEASKFNLDIQFGKTSLGWPNKIYSTVNQVELDHRAPLLESLEKKEFVYGEHIMWKTKGMYFNGALQGHTFKSVNGLFSLSSFETDNHPWNSGKLEPGDYNLQLYAAGRLSNIELITIKSPAIESIMPKSFNRDNMVQINGKSLPYYGDYIFTHLESGRIFTKRNENYGDYSMQKINPVTLIGNGSYQVEIKTPEKSYKYSGTIQLSDYFNFFKKTDVQVSPNSSVGCGIAINNKLYIPQQNGMSIIDLETGSIRVKSGYFNYAQQPVFLNNKIYRYVYKDQKFALCTFNTESEDWDRINIEGLPVVESTAAIGVYNNHLIAFAQGGIYQFDQSWSLLGNIKNKGNYHIGADYILSGNGYLYLFDFYYGETTVLLPVDWSTVKQIKMPDQYHNSLRYIFELNGDMYYGAVPYGYDEQYSFYKFIYKEEKFETLMPKNLIFSVNYHFCPDGKGTVYFVDQNYVYKFNP